MKTKDRLILKMIAGLTTGVTAAALIASGVIGVQEDLLRRNIKNMEHQKIECKDDSQIKQLDEKIQNATIKREKYQDILYPLVGTYLGASIACFATNTYLENKQEKESKQEEGLTK